MSVRPGVPIAATGNPVEERVQRQRQSDAQVLFGNPELHTPPYQFDACRMVWLTATVDKAAARALVPPELSPTSASVAAITIWHSATGTFGPVSGMLVAIEVEGLDSADGSPALFLCAHHIAEPALGAVRHGFFVDAGPMDPLSPADFDAPTVVARRQGEPLLSMSLRPATTSPGDSGMLNYVGRNHRRELVVYNTPYNYRADDAEVVDFALGPALSPQLRALAPREVLFAYTFAELNFSWGVPVPISASLNRRQHDADALLELVGRPAAVVTATGDILNASDGARAILGNGTLLTRVGAEWSALGAAIAAATSDVAPRPSGPLPLSVGEVSRLLIGQVVPLRQRHNGQPVALLLMTDRERAPSGDTTPTLELLGLTPAEARLAALVGGGLSPGAAARALWITQNTARTSLHIIYDKLGVHRMSGLVKLVTQIGGT